MRIRSQEEIDAIKEEQEITHITKDCGMSAVEGVKEIANLMEDDINELFKDDIINNYVKWLVENVGKWVVISRLDAPFENESIDLLFKVWEKLVSHGYSCERSYNKLRINE